MHTQQIANLNKSLADELNQVTSFPAGRSNKKSKKPNEAQKPTGLGFQTKPGFFQTLFTRCIQCLLYK